MTEDSRRTEALDTAFGLFLRFGYRKTSMDDIARAVGLSRQGLYVWYPNKRALFAAVADRALESTLAGVREALEGSGTLEERLHLAFTRMAGLHTDPTLDPAHVDELFEATARLLGDRIDTFHNALEHLLTEALSTHDHPEDAACALLWASKGLKHAHPTPEGYQAGMARAIRVVCG